MPQFGIREALPPNRALELTPLCGPKIVAILTARFCSTAFPICWCGAAQRQAVGLQKQFVASLPTLWQAEDGV
jgi:hypothetical protein